MQRLDTARNPDRRRFLHVASRLRLNDPLWVAPLESEQHRVLGPGNPFHKHAAMELFVATGPAGDVGRLAVIEDRTHNSIHGERTAFFGFFESVEDPAVSGALFNAAADWARHRGLDRLRGPMNPSINDECGLLVEGFDTPPAIMMPHNPPHHAHLLAASGFAKIKDLLAFQMRVADAPAAVLSRFLQKFARREPDVTLRALERRTLGIEVPKIRTVYNLAWEKNWGAVPLTPAEIDFLVERLAPLLVPGLVWVAEVRGEPAGFLLALPDFNQVLRRLRGRLLSVRLPLVLPDLLGWRQPDAIRMVALGVRHEFQGRGIESAMLAKTLEACRRRHFATCEASWTLEDNTAVQRLIARFGGRRHKTYRIFEKPL
ncbi:MAG: GNAT family N-acetyltransferase [Verrucomicrobiae bacterium]|nr:GNAT family N-acetyltransferase [Verrucomicrobiae bacterium]